MLGTTTDHDFIPTIELLKRQAEIWQIGTLAVGLSREELLLEGTNPYWLNSSATDIINASLSDFVQLGSNSLATAYSPEDATYYVSSPAKLSIRLRKTKEYNSVFIFSNDSVLLAVQENGTAAPLKTELLEQTKDFYSTKTDLWLGLASDVDLVLHKSEDRIVAFNSLSDFLGKEVTQETGTLANRVQIPGTQIEFIANESSTCIDINFGSVPAPSGSLTDLYYDCVFLFDSNSTVLFVHEFSAPVLLPAIGTLTDYTGFNTDVFPAFEWFEPQASLSWETNSDIIIF